MSANAPSGTARGFLFADLRGYTEFIENQGEARARELLERYRPLVREAVAGHAGAEIQTEGDSFYIAFASIADAVQCGLAIQRAATEAAIEVGVGIDIGEVTETPDGFVGSAVNTAARLCAIARPGEVLVTEAVCHLLRSHGKVAFVPVGRRRLKGLRRPVAIFRAHVGPLEVRQLPLPASVLAAILVVAIVATSVLAFVRWESRPRGQAPGQHAAVMPSPTPVPVPHGEMLYQPRLDTVGEDFVNSYTYGPTDGTSINFDAGSLVFNMRYPRANMSATAAYPVIRAIDVRMPPESSYVAELKLSLDNAGTFGWVVRTGDGGQVGDRVIVFTVESGGPSLDLRYIDESALLTSVEPWGESLSPLAPFSWVRGKIFTVTAVIDPPRYVVFLDQQPVIDTCDRTQGHALAQSVMKLVATNHGNVPGQTVRITGLRVYALGPGDAPHLKCAA